MIIVMYALRKRLVRLSMIGIGLIKTYPKIGSFKMHQVKLKKKKFIRNAAYEPLKAKLIVTLKNGKVYSFKGIDHILIDKLTKKKKPSKFFKKNIMGVYRAKKEK